MNDHKQYEKISFSISNFFLSINSVVFEVNI